VRPDVFDAGETQVWDAGCDVRSRRGDNPAVARFRSSHFCGFPSLSGALSDGLVLSGMRNAAGVASASGRKFPGSVGHESAHHSIAAVPDVWRVSHALRAIRGRGLPQVFLPAVWVRALGAGIILFGIARNLPIHPFDLLAPGAMLQF